MTRCAPHGDPPAERLGDPEHHREAQARAADASVNIDARLEAYKAERKLGRVSPGELRRVFETIGGAG